MRAPRLPHRVVYLTANLKDESGNSYGAQWTLFRQIRVLLDLLCANTCTPIFEGGNVIEEVGSLEPGDYQRALELTMQNPDQQTFYTYIDYLTTYGQLGRKQEALEDWRKLLAEDRNWSAKSFEDWYRVWNFRDEDIAKFMDGVHKSGVLVTNASQSHPLAQQ